MSITPKGLARSLASAVTRRATVQHVGDLIPRHEDGATSFLVHDNDGGILKVTVTQYKAPLR